MAWAWSEKSERTVELLANGKSIVKTAKEVGVDEKTIDRWKQTPEFRARLDARCKELLDLITKEGLAVREHRILAQRRRHAAIMRFVRKRANNPTLGGVTDDESGFFVRREKTLHVGEQAYEKIEEIELDTAVTTELRELEEAIAVGVGEWKQKVEHSGKIETVSAEAIALTELFDLEELQRAKQRAAQVRQRAANPEAPAE